MILVGFFDYISSNQEMVVNDTFTSTQKYLMIVLLVIISILVIVFKNQIKAYKHEKLILKVLGYVLILNVISHYVWLVFHGEFFWLKTMPFAFCPTTAMILGYILISGDNRLFPYAYFMGLIGGLVSHFLPANLHAGPQFYRFYNFYIQHTIIVFVPLYMAAAYNMFPTIKDSVKSMKVALVVGLTALLVNYINGWETKYAEMNPWRTVKGTPLEWVAIWTNYNVFLYTIILAVMLLLMFIIISYVSNLVLKLTKTSQ